MLSSIGLLLSFALIFLLVLYKVNLGLSFVAGALLLGLVSLSPPLLVDAAIRTFTAFSTIELVFNLLAISALNFVYAASGSSQDLVNSLRKMVSSPVLMILVPMLFGVLPVSGGALFSAPLVDLEGRKMALKTERKIFFNLWFRHIPHLIYPLETALVIAATLSQIPLGDLLLYQLPIFLFGILLGLPLSLHGLDEPRSIRVRRADLKDFTRAFWPILLVVGLIAVLQVKVYLAAALGVVIIMVTRRVTIASVSNRAKALASVTGLAVGLILYRNIFEAGAVTYLSTLIQSQVLWSPLWLVGFAFLIGFVIGESTPSTTLAMAVFSHFTFNPATAGLVFTSVYLGHLISPLHLCFAVTADYFHARLSEMYHRLVPATIITLGVEAAIMLLVMAR